MAIETINGAISYQSQNYTAPKNVASDSDSAESRLQDIQLKVDEKTASVAKTQESDTDEQDSGEKNGAGSRENSDQLKKAIAELNQKSQSTQVQFGVHDKTNRITLKIVDKDTKETIREFPAEKTLDMIAKAWELAGLLVDEKR